MAVAWMGLGEAKEGERGKGAELSDASNSNGGRKRDSNCRVPVGKWKFGGVKNRTASSSLIGLATSTSYSTTAD